MSLLLLLNPTVWGAPGVVCPELDTLTTDTLTLTTLTGDTLTLTTLTGDTLTLGTLTTCET